jgi:hypothetical protein
MKMVVQFSSEKEWARNFVSLSTFQLSGRNLTEEKNKKIRTVGDSVIYSYSILPFPSPFFFFFLSFSLSFFFSLRGPPHTEPFGGKFSLFGGGGSHVLDSANQIAASSKILRP